MPRHTTKPSFLVLSVTILKSLGSWTDRCVYMYAYKDIVIDAVRDS